MVCGVLFAAGLAGPLAAHAEVFFTEDFESGALGQWSVFENPGDPCDSTGQIAPTTEDSASGAYAVKFTIPVGDMCTLMQARNNWPNPAGQGAEIYWRFRLKYAANYQWGDNGNKVAEIRGDRITRDNGARIIFYVNRVREAWSIPIPANPYQAVPFVEVSANDNVKEGRLDETWHAPNDPNGTWFSQNLNIANPVYFATGQWYTFEIYVRVNTDSNGDGVIDRNDAANGAIALWINGTKVIELDNLYTISAPSQTYYMTQLGGTINQPAYVVLEDTHFYFDDVVVTNSGTCQPGADCTAPAAPTNLTVQ
jgi:hypothetical protein